MFNRVGFNLYGANITSGDPPTFLERGDPPPFESSFEYVKDSSKDVEEFGLGATITCDLLGGMIKISGGFDFEMGFSRESNTERMKKCNRVPLNAILIKPNVDTSGSFDPHVEELLKTDSKYMIFLLKLLYFSFMGIFWSKSALALESSLFSYVKSHI